MTIDEEKRSRIASALDLSTLSKEEQEELLLELNDLVFEGVILRLLDQMDDATKGEFEELLSKDSSEEEVSAFLESRMPNFQEVIDSTFADIQNDILAVTGSGSE